jgi:S1-C subfamily serine protease
MLNLMVMKIAAIALFTLTFFSFGCVPSTQSRQDTVAIAFDGQIQKKLLQTSVSIYEEFIGLSGDVKPAPKKNKIGSGVVINFPPGQKNVVYILTAAHLGFEPGNRYWVVFWISPNDDLEMVVEHYITDIGRDLAILKVRGIKVSGLEISDDVDYGRQNIVFGVSSPGDIRGSLISIGISQESMGNTPAAISYSAGIWFGSSGGALVDARTSKLIGIIFKIRHINGGKPRADQGLAVSTHVIKSFLQNLSVIDF